MEKVWGYREKLGVKEMSIYSGIGIWGMLVKKEILKVMKMIMVN